VELIKSLLPITKVIVEVASFDTQKMQNPNISGIEYQQGTLFGYTVRNYLLEKWGHRCVYCKKANIPLNIEHIIPKSRGGSNRVINLTIACHSCNHKKNNQLVSECPPKLRRQITTVQKRANKSFKAATFMTMVRWKIVERLNCHHTYGDRTKYHRTRIGLPKSHVNDAFIIAEGNNKHQRSQVFYVKQVRRNNRSIQKNCKGFRRAFRNQRYKYQPNDLVRFKGKIYRVNGTHNKGTRVVLFIPHQLKKKKSVSINKIELIKYGKGFIFEADENRQFFTP
jgi:5-methylcytosine-specific restriction endonuclease McrA